MPQDKGIDKGSRKGTRIHNPCVSKRLYTLKDAAAYLGRPVSGVRTLIWRGRLPYIQEGRKQYVDVRDLETYVDKGKLTMI